MVEKRQIRMVITVVKKGQITVDNAVVKKEQIRLVITVV